MLEWHTSFDTTPLEGFFFLTNYPTPRVVNWDHSHTSVCTRLPGNSHPRREFSIKTTTFTLILTYFYVYAHYYILDIYIYRFVIYCYLRYTHIYDMLILHILHLMRSSTACLQRPRVHMCVRMYHRSYPVYDVRINTEILLFMGHIIFIMWLIKMI